MSLCHADCMMDGAGTSTLRTLPAFARSRRPRWQAWSCRCRFVEHERSRVEREGLRPSHAGG